MGSHVHVPHRWYPWGYPVNPLPSTRTRHCQCTGAKSASETGGPNHSRTGCGPWSDSQCWPLLSWRGIILFTPSICFIPFTPTWSTAIWVELVAEQDPFGFWGWRDWISGKNNLTHYKVLQKYKPSPLSRMVPDTIEFFSLSNGDHYSCFYEPDPRRARLFLWGTGFFTWIPQSNQSPRKEGVNLLMDLLSKLTAPQNRHILAGLSPSASNCRAGFALLPWGLFARQTLIK